jgi:hypothetical protein
MAFNINTFKSEIEQGGYLRGHTFNVLITIPPNIPNLSSFSSISSQLRLRIDETKSPQITQLAVDVARYGIGTTQKQPFGAQFQDTALSILCDRGGDIWRFWHEWLNYIYGFTGSGPSSYPTYTVAYKSDYATTMDIEIYDQLGDSAIKFTLNDAFPVQLREIPLDWKEEGTLIYLDAIISYKDYYVSNTVTTSMNTTSSYTSNPSATQLITV